jgi:hypothetical protein
MEYNPIVQCPGNPGDVMAPLSRQLNSEQYPVFTIIRKQSPLLQLHVSPRNPESQSQVPVETSHVP